MNDNQIFARDGEVNEELGFFVYYQPMGQEIAFSEMLRQLLEQGFHVVIREFDHRTAAAATALGTHELMQVMSDAQARLYIESPSGLNDWLSSATLEELQGYFTDQMYHPRNGWSDEPYDALLVGAREADVHLRFHDHGYGEALQPDFPEGLEGQGSHVFELLLSGNAACAEDYLTRLPRENALAIGDAIKEVLSRRFDGSGDRVNASFVLVNAEGHLTVSVIGALHQQFYEHMQQVTGRVVDVTVFDSEHPLPPYLRELPIESSIIGSYAYDTHTGQMWDARAGTEGRTQFFEYLHSLEIERAPLFMQCPAPVAPMALMTADASDRSARQER